MSTSKARSSCATSHASALELPLPGVSESSMAADSSLIVEGSLVITKTGSNVASGTEVVLKTLAIIVEVVSRSLEAGVALVKAG